MSTRIFFAGILGGIVMFIWSFIGHDLLPLGKAGVHEMPNEMPSPVRCNQTSATELVFTFFRDPASVRMRPDSKKRKA
jgi:hypothetical protein